MTITHSTVAVAGAQVTSAGWNAAHVITDLIVPLTLTVGGISTLNDKVTISGTDINKILEVVPSMDIQPAGTKQAISAEATFTNSGAGAARYPQAFNMLAYYNSGLNFTGFLSGAVMSAVCVNTGTGNIRVLDISGGNTGSGTISDYRGICIRDVTNSGGGAVTANYALRILAQIGGNSNFAIWAQGGKNYFQDNTIGNYAVQVHKNVSAAAEPPIRVIQDHLTGAQPCLELDQDDVSEGFIDLVGSDRGVIAGATNSLASARIELNGVVYRIALYVDA